MFSPVRDRKEVIIMTKEFLIKVARAVYGNAKKITKKILNTVKDCINHLKAKLGIPVIKLEYCRPRCHISTSNIKTDIPSWSTYPGDDIITLKDGRKVSDYTGTCSAADCESCKNWHSCYAIRMLRYPAVAKGYIENTMFLREDINGLEKELVKQISKLNTDLFRFDVSGEIETFEQLIMFLSVAYQQPEKIFYVYTKNYDAVNRYFETGCELPGNFHILISIWHSAGTDCFKKHMNHNNVHCFIYNDGFNYNRYGLELLSNCQCKAYNEKGKLNHDITCRKCKKCWTKKIIWTFPH